MVDDHEDPGFSIINEGGMRPAPSPSPSLSPSPLSSSLSESDSPRDSSPASSVSIATHDTSRTKYHIPDLSTFAARLEHAAKSIFPNKGRSRYKNVRVLLLRWEEDPMGVQYELDDLAKAFRNKYGFETETWLIPSVKSHFALMGKVLQVVQNWGQADDLLVVYYAGHGLMNASRQALWSCRENVGYASVQWYAIQTLFEQAESDVLLLLDCCSAASGAPTDGISASVTETIAACGFETWAPQPGRHSFTNTLIDVLKDWQHRGAFTAAMLHCEVLNRLRHEKPERYRNTEKFEYRKSPIHIVSTSDPKARSVELCPRMSADETQSVSGIVSSAEPRGRGSVVSKPGPAFEEVAERFDSLSKRSLPKSDVYNTESIAKVLEDSSTAVPHVLISLALEEEQLLDFEQCRRWLQDFPALAKFAKVQAVYRSNSTLLLLSVPVAVWNWIPDDPACVFIGYVHSDNLLKNSIRQQGSDTTTLPTSNPLETRKGQEFSKTSIEPPHEFILRRWQQKFCRSRYPYKVAPLQAFFNLFSFLSCLLILLCLSMCLKELPGVKNLGMRPISDSGVGLAKALSEDGATFECHDMDYTFFKRDFEPLRRHFEAYKPDNFFVEKGPYLLAQCCKRFQEIYPSPLACALDMMDSVREFLPESESDSNIREVLDLRELVQTKNRDTSLERYSTFELDGEQSDMDHYSQTPINEICVVNCEPPISDDQILRYGYVGLKGGWPIHNIDPVHFGWLHDIDAAHLGKTYLRPDGGYSKDQYLLFPLLTICIPAMLRVASYLISIIWDLNDSRERALFAIVQFLNHLIALLYVRCYAPYLVIRISDRLVFQQVYLWQGWVDVILSPRILHWSIPFAIDLVYLITVYWYRAMPQRLDLPQNSRTCRRRRQRAPQYSRRLKNMASLLNPLVLPLLTILLVREIETLYGLSPSNRNDPPPYTEPVLFLTGFLLVFERGWIKIGLISFSVWLLLKIWDATKLITLHIWDFVRFSINRCPAAVLWAPRLVISASRSLLGMLKGIPTFLAFVMRSFGVVLVTIWELSIEISSLTFRCHWNILSATYNQFRLILGRGINFRPGMDHVRYLGQVTLSILAFFQHWLDSHIGDVALLVLVLEAVYLPMMIFNYNSWERFLTLVRNFLDTYLHRELISDVLMYEFKYFYEWVVNYFVTILAKTTALYLFTLCIFDTSIFLLAMPESSGSKISLPNYSELDEYLKVMSHSDVERIVAASPASISWNILLATYEASISGALIFAIDYLSAKIPLPRPIDAPMIIGMLIVYYVAWEASKPLRSWQLSRKSDREIMERLLGGDFGQNSELQVVTMLLKSWVFGQILRVSVIIGLFLLVYRVNGIGLTELARWGLNCIFETIFSFWSSFCWSIYTIIGIVALLPVNPDKRALLRIVVWTCVCSATLVSVLIMYPDFWSTNQNHGMQFKLQTKTAIDLIKWFACLVLFYLTTEMVPDFFRHDRMLNVLAELENEVQGSRRMNRWAGTNNTAFSKGWKSSNPRTNSQSPSYWDPSASEAYLSPEPPSELRTKGLGSPFPDSLSSFSKSPHYLS